MQPALQRACAWCGIGFLVVLFVMFMIVAGLIPPLSPTSSAEQITAHLIDNKLRIRWGVALMLVTSALVVPFNAALALRIRRAEGGRWGVLSITQLLAAAALYPAGFYCPLMVLACATFRPESRPPELTLALDDLFWLMLIGFVGPLVLQALVIAVATFTDTSATPTFPRWFGYFNIWYAVLAAPAALVVVFNDGPLSWNGVFAFWVPLGAFAAWYIALVVLMLRAIEVEASELTPHA
ncbi:hypothetical protein ABIA30_005122 [Mycobacterium sp. MAA66]|uniref:hypothetical protein n=1 Tax=Mycobacterium sp. MAA66 TaxID=3156297 RepID=UPI003515F79C